jgi:HNH endonuclease
VIDPFDLEAWPIPDAAPGRIYADNNLELFALVSPDDYPWACRHTWSALRRPGRQVYLRRNAEPGRTRCPTSGVVIRGVQTTLYLHVEIMKRTGRHPPTPKHEIVDHFDLDSLNCQRQNLRWVTYSINNKNRRQVAR